MEIILNDYHKKVNAGKWSMVTLSFVIIVMYDEKNRSGKRLRMEEKWLRMIEKSVWVDEKRLRMIDIEAMVVITKMGY